MTDGPQQPSALRQEALELVQPAPISVVTETGEAARLITRMAPLSLSDTYMRALEVPTAHAVGLLKRAPSAIPSLQPCTPEPARVDTFLVARITARMT